VTINMICSNMALLQTILDVQVKILAKVNNQDVSQVNAMVDTLYHKYRKKAMNDLMDFDKDA
jgi:sulfatase maturation enzyme AslB (radical SAM superfamily)